MQLEQCHVLRVDARSVIHAQVEAATIGHAVEGNTLPVIDVETQRLQQARRRLHKTVLPHKTS